MSANEPFISLQNVRKVYRSKGTEFLAVSDVTMDVQEGELVSLVGPSGCCKTTVLKILAGLHDADGGTIKIGNSKTPFDPARESFLSGSICSGHDNECRIGSGSDGSFDPFSHGVG